MSAWGGLFRGRSFRHLTIEASPRRRFPRQLGRARRRTRSSLQPDERRYFFARRQPGQRTRSPRAPAQWPPTCSMSTRRRSATWPPGVRPAVCCPRLRLWNGECALFDYVAHGMSGISARASAALFRLRKIAVVDAIFKPRAITKRISRLSPRGKGNVRRDAQLANPHTVAGCPEKVLTILVERDGVKIRNITNNIDCLFGGLG